MRTGAAEGARSALLACCLAVFACAEAPSRDPGGVELAGDEESDAQPPPLRRTTLRTGAFLVASERLADPNFAATVVLLLRHGAAAGAVGVVVNRPSRVELASLLPQVEGLEGSEIPVYYGGPVERQRLLFLINSREPPPGSVSIVAGVHASGSLEALERQLARPAPERRLRAYAGYAGWAPGQLEAEVARDDWHVLATDAATVFDRRPTELWERLIDELAGVWAEAPLGGAGRPSRSAAGTS